jgi:hypothetical protein
MFEEIFGERERERKTREMKDCAESRGASTAGERSLTAFPSLSMTELLESDGSGGPRFASAWIGGASIPRGSGWIRLN